MNTLSFDNKYNKIKRHPDQDNLYDLFQKNIVNSNTLPLKIYVVPREYEMRLDRISQHIYGTPDYVEELMVLNDILNPYSVKEGQYIYFTQIDNLPKIYTKDELSIASEKNRDALIASSQPNRDKMNTVSNNANLPPTVKPSGLEQVKVTKDNKIKIINTFE